MRILHQSKRRLLELKTKVLIWEESVKVLDKCVGVVADLLKKQYANRNERPTTAKSFPELNVFF